MIRETMIETMIDAERDKTFADERLCDIDDMTYREWIGYQDHMLKYYAGYLGNES